MSLTTLSVTKMEGGSGFHGGNDGGEGFHQGGDDSSHREDYHQGRRIRHSENSSWP